jgi:N-acetylmuramoyl-L-alanine amidase
MDNTPEPMPLFDDDLTGASDDVSDSQSPDNAAEEAVTSDTDESSPAEHSDNDPVTPQPEDAAGQPEPPAAMSVSSSSVGSVDEMDAWLSAGPAPAASGWMATDSEADAAMAAWLAADPNAMPEQDGPVVVTAGRLERVRPKRKPLVPVWLVWVVLGVLLIGGIAAGASAYLAVRAKVFVPTVAGLQTPAARERLATVGLTLTVTDRRFSTLPVDTILAQTPEAGAETKRGTAVAVVVSAGTEQFTMPDVVGEGLTLARSQLEQKGLQVQVEAQASDQPSDTVLATNPAAGAPMNTGDIVKLTVAMNASGSGTTTSSTGALVPFTLTGVRVTLDPAPPVAGQPDTALEVTRRLQSLLEASGATVLSTRSITDTGTTGSATARQLRAREGSPTVAVGFDVISTGGAGVALTYPSSTVATASAAPSQILSSQISSALAGQGISARQTAGGSDVVLSVTGAPYVRLTLGSTASTEDLANFRDPTWADKIARSVYQGIASIYGIRNVGAP